MALAWVGTGCQGEPGPQTLSIFAASSLTDVFRAIEPPFEQTRSDVDLSLTFAGSQVLRLQIEQLAPAEVFASADQAHLQALVDAGRVDQGEVFARNELVMIVPVDDPAGLESFADLPRARRLVIGTPQVPVGRYTAALLRDAASHYGEDFESRVRARVVSEESNVRLVRAKVELGEADAAIVYRSDAEASSRVRMIPIPAELNVSVRYFVGLVVSATDPEPGRAFVHYLHSPGAQQALREHGFLVES